MGQRLGQRLEDVERRHDPEQQVGRGATTIARTLRVALRRWIRSPTSTSMADSAVQAHTSAGPPASRPVAMAALVSPKAARRSVRSACGRRTATGTAASEEPDDRQRPERETGERVAVELAEPAVEERGAERERERARRP